MNDAEGDLSCGIFIYVDDLRCRGDLSCCIFTYVCTVDILRMNDAERYLSYGIFIYIDIVRMNDAEGYLSYGIFIDIHRYSKNERCRGRCVLWHARCGVCQGSELSG
jgi:hypothetical protein